MASCQQQASASPDTRSKKVVVSVDGENKHLNAVRDLVDLTGVFLVKFGVGDSSELLFDGSTTANLRKKLDAISMACGGLKAGKVLMLDLTGSIGLQKGFDVLCNRWAQEVLLDAVDR